MLYMMLFLLFFTVGVKFSGGTLMLGGLMPLMLIMFSMYSLNESIKIEANWAVFDTISIGLMSLSVFLIVLMILASSLVYNMKHFNFLYLLFFLFLLMALLLSFLSGDFVLFYFSFEMSLIPTLMIILGWGYQPERLQAGIYLMMYTLIASLPLLFSLMYLVNNPIGGLMWDYYLFENYSWGFSLSSYLVCLSLTVAFLIKLPMFMVHLWLPKAHVEAPVAGSMILAGVLLKLGGYGLSRVIMKFNILLKMNSYLVSLSLMGMFFIGLICCRLNDLKALVAYSSVAHMGLVVCGLFSGGLWGLSGSILMMISHGLSSSGLFCFMNLLYERSGSRSVFINSGLLSLAPFFSLMLFLLCCSNISAPPSINLLSEITLIVSVLKFNSWSMIVFPLGSFLGAVFTFYMFSYVHHGKIFNEFESSPSSHFIELHVLGIHLIPVNFLALKSEVFLSV